MAYGVCHQFDVKTVTQSSPSPVISLVHTLPYGAEPLLHSDTGSSASPSTSSGNEQEASKALKDVHLPTRLMDMFLDLASGNTSKDLETCGVLGASLKKGTFYVTTLIIPKQESESNSCQALHEEEIFSIQNQQGLFPIGWIHTHPSQSCFMSSIDLHTQYSYQVMVPEAVGIVMAPTDKSRDYGIFRLSNSGMRILKDCSEKGFHPHREPGMSNKWSKKEASAAAAREGTNLLTDDDQHLNRSKMMRVHSSSCQLGHECCAGRYNLLTVAGGYFGCNSGYPLLSDTVTNPLAKL